MEVDGAIGELSSFHSLYGYYAQGVEIESACLPSGWRDRLVSFTPSAADPAEAVCLERHDLVVSKLVAMRQKDKDFAMALLRAGLVDPQILHDRAGLLGTAVAPGTAAAVQRWVIASSRVLGLPEPTART